MSYGFELYYKAPADHSREERILNEVRRWGGRLDYREEPTRGDRSQAIVLTFEFDHAASADSAASALRQLGEHVEEMGEYG